MINFLYESLTKSIYINLLKLMIFNRLKLNIFIEKDGNSYSI